MTTILIVDSDKFFEKLASSWLKAEGYDVKSEPNLSQGIKLLDSLKPEVVFVARPFSETGPSDDLIKEYINSSVSPRVIITGYHLDPKKILEDLEYGAFDCFEKPMMIKNAFTGENELRKRIITTVACAIISAQSAISLDGNFKRGNIIGNSRAIISCLAELKKAAMTEQPILITGETGTGKQLFAEAAHNNSSRFKDKFVQLNSGALPETTISSELFGYKKGSHSTAKDDKDGLIKQADGGTLFLDEIGILSLEAQEQLLVAIEKKRFYPLGAAVTECSNFRLVSATNADLEQKINEGSFRADFFNRINVFVIHLPPLRDRKEDIKDIAKHFIKQLSAKLNLRLKPTQEFMDALEMFKWDGNVRELKNVINRSVAYASGTDVLNPDHLPSNIRGHWIANKWYKVHRSTEEEIAQSWEELVLPTEKDEGQNPHQHIYYEMDYETGIPLYYSPPITDTVQSVDPPMSNNSAVDVTPEDIIGGRATWGQIKKLLYLNRVSIMVVARSLWRKQKKDLAAKLGVNSNTLEKFFSSVKIKAKNGELNIDNLKPYVSVEHYPVLQTFLEKATDGKE